jgi:predicted HicB family RNase H-like nuclease
VIGMSEKEPKTSLTLYIPVSVKKKLEEKAKEKGVSMSQYISSLIEEEKPS